MAVFLFIHGNTLWGEILLGLSILLSLAKTSLVNFLAKPFQWLLSLTPLKLFSLLSIAWIGFSLELLSFPSHRWMVPKITTLPNQYQYSLWVLFSFWIGLIIIIRLFPRLSSGEPDLSPWVAGFWLLLIMGMDSFLVFYQAGKPISAASEDTIVFSAFARLIFDTKDYRFFFNGGAGNSWQPLYQWLMQLAWHFKPEAPGLLIERIVSGMINLVTVLALYLAGKESMGRRMGLFAAALGATCLPLLTKTLACQHGNTHTMVEALTLWLFFKSLRTPKLSNFLLWGATIASGIYGYIVFRPLVGLFGMSALIWILFLRKEERKMEKPVFLMVALSAFVFVLYMLYTNHYFVTSNLLSVPINIYGSFAPCLILGTLLVFALQFGPQLLSVANRYPYLFGWTAGIWLCMILSFPQMANPVELWNLVRGGAADPSHHLTFKPLSTFTYFFDVHSCDWINLHHPEDAFFGYTELIFGGLGLALAFAHPDPKKIYLLFIFATTFGIWLLTDSIHSERMMICVPPFLLLGAFGIDQLWNWLEMATKNRLVRTAAVVFFVGLFEWSGQALFERVHNQWADKTFDVDDAVCLRVLSDQKHGYRVYIGPDLTWSRISFVLYENHPVQVLKNSNPIYLEPGEKPKDLILYFRGKDSHQQDDHFADLVAKQFPHAQWENIRSPFDESEWPIASRCYIPYGDLVHNKKQNLFLIQKITAPYWTREFYTADTGFRPGILDWVDKTTRANDPTPAWTYPDFEATVLQGTIHMKQGGLYQISCTAESRTHVLIDGRDILNMYFPRTEHYTTPKKTETHSINLATGDHRVEVSCLLPRSHQNPDITLHPAGSPGPDQSLWSSFFF